MATDSEPVEEKDASSRRDEIVSGVKWAWAFQMANVGSSAFMFIVLARVLGPSGFGYFAALTGISGLLSAVVNSWTGFVLTERVIRERKPIQPAFESVTSWTIIIAVAAMAATVPLRDLVFPKVPLGTSLVFISAAVVGQSASFLGSSALQSVLGLGQSMRVSVVQQSALLVALSALWASGGLSLFSVAVVLSLTAAAAGIANLYRARNRCGLVIRPGRPDPEDLRRAVAYGISLLSSTVSEDIDKPMLVHYGFSAAAGIYSAGYNVVTTALMPLDALTAATHNRFLEHDPEAIGEHRRRATRMTTFAVAYGTVALVGLLLAAPIVPLILGSPYRSSVTMIRWLAFIVLTRSAAYFPFNGLMGLGRRGWRVAIVVVTATVNVIINVALDPSMSWKGAAIATLAAESLATGLTWYALLRCQRAHDRGVLAAAGRQP